MRGIDGFQKGLMVIFRKIKLFLVDNNLLLITVTGNSGAGKTTFTSQLKGILERKSIKIFLISSDYFYKPGTHDLDLKQLQKKINHRRGMIGRKGGVIIVEGVQAMDEKVLGQAPDLKIHLKSHFWECLSRRLVRDHRSGRINVSDRLRQIVDKAKMRVYFREKTRNKNPEIRINFCIHNDYIEPGNPKLFVDNNTFQFILNDKVCGTESITREESRALQKIGIKSTKYIHGS